jgi:hypothetical protein
MKTLTNCENPSSNCLQIACCGIQEAACDSVNCFFKPEMILNIRYYFSKYQADNKLSAFPKDELRLTILFELPPVLFGAGGGDSDAASGKISRIIKCFHRSKQDLKKYFSEQKRRKKI